MGMVGSARGAGQDVKDIAPDPSWGWLAILNNAANNNTAKLLTSHGDGWPVLRWIEQFAFERERGSAFTVVGAFT